MVMATLLCFTVLVLRATLVLGSDGTVGSSRVCSADGACDAPATVAARPDDGGQELFEWIRDHGGFVHPGLRVGPLDPDDASSPFGVFTKVSLRAGEVLIRVPWQLILQPEVEGYNLDERFCSTVEVVEREESLGNASYFAPYMKYLTAHNPVLDVPGMWSHMGKTLLHMVMGSGTRATGVGSLNSPLQRILVYCGFLSRQTQATALRVFTRHTRELMVPLMDMLNHGSGDKHNSVLQLRHGRYFGAKALRDIKAGDEICDSYTHCSECADRSTWFGTSELFFEYGFIESMPQVWHLLWDLHFSLGPTGTNKSEIRASWLKEVQDPVENLAWTQLEVDRLNHVGGMLLKHHGSVPQHEWSAILQYHSALSLALSKTVEALTELTTQLEEQET